MVFTLGTGDIFSFEEASIAVLDLETREHRVILEGGTNFHYSPTGHLVYARDGSVFAVPFDRSALEVKGVPVPLVQGVATSPHHGAAEFDVSRDGTLVYAPGDAWGVDYRMVWVDRQVDRSPSSKLPVRTIKHGSRPTAARWLSMSRAPTPAFGFMTSPAERWVD